VLRSRGRYVEVVQAHQREFPKEVLGVGASASKAQGLCGLRRASGVKSGGLGSPQDHDAGPNGGAAESAPPICRFRRLIAVRTVRVDGVRRGVTLPGSNPQSSPRDRWN
jgi:hypothetical protein